MSASFSSTGYRMRWTGKMSLALSLSGVVLLSSPFMTGHAEALPEELRGLTQPPEDFNWILPAMRARWCKRMVAVQTRWLHG